MFTTEIKNYAKSQFKKNRKFYLNLSSKYIGLCLLVIFLPFIPKILNALLSGNFTDLNLNISSYNIYVNVIFNLLYYALLIVFSLKIFFNEMKSEKCEKFCIEYRVRIVKFIGIIILIQSPFVIASALTASLLYQSGLSTVSIQLLQVIFSLLKFILYILLYFSTCSFALYPENSIKSTIRESIKMVVIYISDWFVFEISFFLWHFIPYILMIIILFLLGYTPSHLYLQKDMLLISLIAFLNSPLIFGFGFFFFPYYHIAKLNLYKKISKKNATMK